MKDSEAFDYFSTDPLQWLATGKRHWLCAAFLRDELKRITPVSSTIEEVRNFDEHPNASDRLLF
jgi:hypothetical protein